MTICNPAPTDPVLESSQPERYSTWLTNRYHTEPHLAPLTGLLTKTRHRSAPHPPHRPRAHLGHAAGVLGRCRLDAGLHRGGVSGYRHGGRYSAEHGVAGQRSARPRRLGGAAAQPAGHPAAQAGRDARSQPTQRHPAEQQAGGEAR